MAIDFFDGALRGVRTMFRTAGSVWDTARINVAAAESTELPASERYALQRAYYANNALYESIQRMLYRVGADPVAIRGLRNPAYRIVTFYEDLLWPGRLPEALPIIPDETNSAIIDPIHQIWKWSNWGTKKQVYALWLAMLGDVFIEVVRSSDGGIVYFHLLDPALVTDFETDPRGNVIWLRTDVLVRQGTRRDSRLIWHTEVWSKADQSKRVWEHSDGPDAEIEDLGEPIETQPFGPMGIDFVPIVYVPFKDVGEGRAPGAFTFQIDKIDNINREATKLSQMLFRHGGPSQVFIGGRDSDGRELPPPVVITNTATGTMERRSDDIISVGGDTKVTSLVPNINWQAHLDIIKAGLSDLTDDCPEMAWWQVREFGRSNDVSGRALNYILAPAIKRLLGVRGNGEDGIVRADMMALTMGSRGIPRLFNVPVGTFESGDFDHRFEEREVVPISDLEKSETDRGRALAAQAWIEAGFPPEMVLERNGYAADDITDILKRMGEIAADKAEQEAAQAEARAASFNPATTPTEP